MALLETEVCQGGLSEKSLLPVSKPLLAMTFVFLHVGALDVVVVDVVVDREVLKVVGARVVVGVLADALLDVERLAEV